MFDMIEKAKQFDLANGFDDVFYDVEPLVPSLFNLFSPRSLSGLFPEIPLFEQVKYPMNISTTKAGNQIIELAVCGKSKNDIEVSWERIKNGCAVLNINVNDSNKETEEEKEYEVRKLKKSIQQIQLVIGTEFNMDKLYSKIKDGLLTIVIPKAEVKPTEKKIVEIH